MSQGAMVLHGIQLDPEVQSKVVAVVTYGVSKPCNELSVKLTVKQDPILDVEFHQNRLELPINSKGCIIRNCNKGDYFCDAKGRENGTSDPNDWTPHWDYVRVSLRWCTALSLLSHYAGRNSYEGSQSHHKVLQSCTEGREEAGLGEFAAGHAFFICLLHFNESGVHPTTRSPRNQQLRDTFAINQPAG